MRKPREIQGYPPTLTVDSIFVRVLKAVQILKIIFEFWDYNSVPESDNASISVYANEKDWLLRVVILPSVGIWIRFCVELKEFRIFAERQLIRISIDTFREFPQ